MFYIFVKSSCNLKRKTEWIKSRSELAHFPFWYELSSLSNICLLTQHVLTCEKSLAFNIGKRKMRFDERECTGYRVYNKLAND